MTPNFALALPHAPWAPGRGESFTRLQTALFVEEDGWLDTRIFDEREPNHKWSERVWQWGAGIGTSHLVVVQDDVEVAPSFWDILRAMVTARPEAVWGLHSPRGLTPTTASVYASSDGLIGTAYCIPTRLLPPFLAWRGEITAATLEGMVGEGFGEDSLLGLWCYTQGIPILHPRPSFIHHDTTIASTYGNEAHSGRQPAYPLDFGDKESIERMSRPEFWAGHTPIPERYYDSTHVSWMRYRDDCTRVRFLAGDKEVRDQRRARTLTLQGGVERKPRIKIATPRRDGWVTDLCARTRESLMRWPEVDVLPGAYYDYDVDVARAYLVRDFLTGDGTHLFWIDTKVGFGPALAGGMLRASLVGNHDFIAAPYARTMSTPGHIRWSVRLLPGDAELPPPDQWGCSEAAGVGLGCALMTRGMLARMVEAHAALTFTNPGQAPAVDLFGRTIGLLEDDHGAKPSEDHAFAARWRAIGGRVMLYRGNGAPAEHASMTTWGGTAS